MREPTDAQKRIMEAALSAFCDHGYDGSRTREIASRAQVNEVTLFRHFGTKAELFREVLRHHSPLRIVSAEEGIALSGDVQNDLRALAKAYLDTALPMAGVIRLGVREVGRTPELLEMAQEIPMTLRGHLSGYLQEQTKDMDPPCDADMIAHIFYAVLLQSVLRHGENFGDPDPYTVGRGLADLIARSLTSGPGPDSTGGQI